MWYRPERHQHLIICSLSHYQHFLKIPLKSVLNFWSYLANKQTDFQIQKCLKSNPALVGNCVLARPHTTVTLTTDVYITRYMCSDGGFFIYSISLFAFLPQSLTAGSVAASFTKWLLHTHAPYVEMEAEMTFLLLWNVLYERAEGSSME